jgi:hypothetical protein
MANREEQNMDRENPLAQARNKVNETANAAQKQAGKVADARIQDARGKMSEADAKLKNQGQKMNRESTDL